MPTLAELEGEITALQERLRVTSALAEAMRAYEASVGKVIRQSANLSIRQVSRPVGRGSPAMSETEKAAADLMVRTGKPAPTALVVQEMVNQGMSIPPGNAVNVISARLSNNPKFKAKRGIGYWLVDRPWPGEEGQDPLSFKENEPPEGDPKDGSETAHTAQ